MDPELEQQGEATPAPEPQPAPEEPQPAPEPTPAAAPEPVEPTPEPTPEDWQAKYERMREYSRLWEARAKASRDEIASLKAEKESLEQQLIAAQGQAMRARLVETLAGEYAVNPRVLERMAGATEEEIRENARFLAESSPKFTYPVVAEPTPAPTPPTPDLATLSARDRVIARANMLAAARGE